MGESCTVDRSHPNVYSMGRYMDAEKCNNFNDNNPAGGGYTRYQTAPVGSYQVMKAPGLQGHDGNVFEWCQDWYKSYPGSTHPFDYGINNRIIRGGSWSGKRWWISLCDRSSIYITE